MAEHSIIESQNIDVVKKAYEHFKTGDLQGLLAQFSDDISWHTPGFPKVPYAGRFRSRGEVAQFFVGLGKTAQFERFEPQEYLAREDRVVVFGFYAGLGRETGRPFATDWAMLFTVRNGKIAAFREFFDTANLGSAFS